MPVVPHNSPYNQSGNYSQELNLDEYDIFFECDINDPMFFDVSNLPDILTYGKHYFTISLIEPDENIQYTLKNGSQILFEFKDSKGTVIYSDLTGYTDINGSSTAYVNIKNDPLRSYDEIHNGWGTLTLVGQLTGVPSEWENVYNVRLIIPINIRKGISNNSPILFAKEPNFTASLLRNNDSLVSDGITRQAFEVEMNNLTTMGGKVEFVELAYMQVGSLTSSLDTQYKDLVRWNLTEDTGSGVGYASGSNSDGYTKYVNLPWFHFSDDEIRLKLRFLNSSGEYAEDITTDNKILEISQSLEVRPDQFSIRRQGRPRAFSAYNYSGSDQQYQNAIEGYATNNDEVIGLMTPSDHVVGGYFKAIGPSGSNDKTVIGLSADGGAFPGGNISPGEPGANVWPDYHTASVWSAKFGGETGCGDVYMSQKLAIGSFTGFPTDHPDESLHVSGNVKIEGDLYITGSSYVVETQVNTGSNVFGDASSDTHTFNGSLVAGDTSLLMASSIQLDGDLEFDTGTSDRTIQMGSDTNNGHSKDLFILGGVGSNPEPGASHDGYRGGNIIIKGGTGISDGTNANLGYGEVIVSASWTSDRTESIFKVEHPLSGSLLEVSPSNSESGSLALSGSLFLKDNAAIPAVSESKLYNSGGTLHWSGDAHNATYPIIPKARHYYHHNFIDDIGTSKVMIPWFDASEGGSVLNGGQYANLFPCDATLLKAYVRISTPDATADLTMALDYREAGSTTTINRGTLLKEIASTDDAKVIFYDWGGTLTSGVNTVPAGAMVGIGLTGESTGLMGNEYINVTTVWELDYSTELTASIG